MSHIQVLKVLYQVGLQCNLRHYDKLRNLIVRVCTRE